jgi:AcrR family transcriptional regulator
MGSNLLFLDQTMPIDMPTLDSPQSDSTDCAIADAPMRPALGRRASTSKAELISAALALTGPERSIGSLSLREISREAGIAPNSFYRHFKDVDELAIALIEQAGHSLRTLIGEARERMTPQQSVARTSMMVFMEQLHSDQGYLHLLLREGKVGSVAFKQAVDQQLVSFEQELCADLVTLEAAQGHDLYAPELAAKAITRLVFSMGAVAMDQPKAHHVNIMEQTICMIRMIIVGARMMKPTPSV